MEKEFFKAKGKIQYILSNVDPTQDNKAANIRVGAKKRAGKPWVLVEVPNGIAMYYRTLVVNALINPFRQEQVRGKIEFDRLHPPKWGAHITVLDGRYDVPTDRMKFWEKYQNKIIEYEYSHVIEQHWKFFVLPVRSVFLNELRKELGLPPKHFHITVGRIE